MAQLELKKPDWAAESAPVPLLPEWTRYTEPFSQNNSEREVLGETASFQLFSLPSDLCFSSD